MLSDSPVYPVYTKGKPLTYYPPIEILEHIDYSCSDCKAQGNSGSAVNLCIGWIPLLKKKDKECVLC